jgi:hypothetical protein
MEDAILRNGGFDAMHGAHRGWFIHASVYVAVNLLLVALALLHGRTPMLAPALGWGIGLAVHAAVALLVAGRGQRKALA